MHISKFFRFSFFTFPACLVCGLLIIGNGCSPSGDRAKRPIVLTYSIFFPPSHVQAKLAMSWAKEVERRSQNRVKIMVFAGGSLTKADQCYQGVVDGITSIGMSAFAYTRGRFPLLEGLDLPMGYPDGFHATRIVDAMAKKFQPKEVAETKILYVHAHGPGVLATAKKPVQKLEDLHGMKIRATGFSAGVVEHLGASPIGMSQGETYEALQKGVVDATFCPIETLKGWKQGEVIQYMTESQCVGYTTSFFVVMNREEWNGLPSDIQKIIEDTSSEWLDKHGKAWNEADEAGLAFIKGMNKKILPLSPEEQKKWKSRIHPMLDEYVKNTTEKGLPGKEFLQELQHQIDLATQEKVK